MIRKHITFHGWVQGVGFRYRARHAANLYGCTGWVRNEWDGSDGTDGPTDAAGGYTDYESLSSLMAAGLNLHEVLADNDAYHALNRIGGLIMTGPTGTNVNDVAVALLRVS